MEISTDGELWFLVSICSVAPVVGQVAKMLYDVVVSI